MNDGSGGLPELDAECIWLCDYCQKKMNYPVASSGVSVN